MGRFYVWEAMTYLNKRSSLGRVVINPPEKLQPTRPEVQTEKCWFICKCGRAFENEGQYKDHTKSHSKNFSVDWKSKARGWKKAIKGSMHKCGQCGKLLQTAAALRNHMFIHTGEKPWQCEKCPAVFRLYSTLYDHKKVSHVPGGKFKCPECPCRFTAQLGLKRHVGIYHPRVDPEEVDHAEDALTATNNAKNVKNSGGVILQQGIRKRAPALTAVISEDGTRTYPCEYCNKVFNKSQNLRSHLPVHTGERNSVCNMCGVAFKSSSNLLAHKKVSHVEGGSHKCEKCPCVFASFLGLVRHKRLFHGKSQMMTKKVKQAKSKTVVKLPVQVQLEEEEGDEESENMEVWEEGGNEQAEEGVDATEDADDKGTYECNQCGKVLSSLLCLRNHQMIHTGEKPWICNLCGAAFRLNSTLYGHKKTSHVPNGPYKCDECSCRFAAVFGLKRHKICFHEGGEASPLAVVQSSGKISKCSQCPKAFKSAAALQEHMRSHTAGDQHAAAAGGRSVQCPKCRGTYSTSRALKKHMRTAHIAGGKKCSMCTCSFISLQALKAHAAKVHGRSGVSALKVEQPVLAAVKALKSRGVTVEPTHGSSEDLSYDEEKPYPCDRCGKNFTTDTSLKNHQRYCAQETIACDICGESFSIYSNMIRHKRTCHVPNGPYKCSMCTHCYSTTRGFSRHMAHAHGEYKTKPGLPVKHGMAKPGVAIQRIIDNSKMRTMAAQQQKRPYHRIPEALRKYRCTLCGNTFSTTGNFKKHMITSHVPGGKFPCSFCTCVFNTYNALNSHVGNRHSTKFNDSAPVETSRKTVIAKQIAPKRVSLPIQKASPPKPATSMLSKIKFNFLKPPTSLPHPTSAPTPPKRKPPTELMKRMARIVGGSSPPKDLPLLLPRPIPPLAKVKVEAEEAPQNEYSNDDDDGYNAEYGAGSSELLLSSAEQPRCEICGKSYSNMHSLRGHMTVHTGEKPFPCTLCGQRFRQKGDVVSHKKTNHTDGRFKCNLCPCRFTTPQGLKRHRVSIHHTNVDALQLKPFKSHPLASIMKPKVEKAEPTETYSKVTLAFGSPSAPSPAEPKPVVNKIKQGREYECDLCDASFNHQQNLMRHRKSSHVPWGEFKCSTCSCSFVSPTSLRTHEAIFHQRKSGKNPGLVKPKSFMQTPMMRPVSFPKQHSQHQQIHSLKRKILQPNIGSLSRTPKVLKDARGRPSYVCELCGATFATHSICVKHLNTSHVEGGQYGCGQCICIFHSKQGLARHETVYHSGRKGEQRLVSSIAQMRKFEVEVESMESEEDNGGEHYGDHDSSEHDGMYGNHFEEEDEEEIMMGHDSGNCEMDPLDTTSSSREDHDEDEYFADRVKVEAAAVYSDEEGTDPMSEQLNDSSDSPTSNKEATGSGDGDRPHGTVYGTAGALPKGRVNRFAVYAKKDQHVCGICKLSFTQAASLKGHMRIHTGDKPYQCRYCGICFRLNGTLATHVKKCHEQENPYQCEFCSCSFITPGVLTQHILKFHPAQIKEETA